MRRRCSRFELRTSAIWATVVPLAAGYLTAAIGRLLGKDASAPKLCVACGGHPPRKTNATLPSTLFVAGKLFLVEIYA